MAITQAAMAAVRRKLHITWDDEMTDQRLQDVVDAVSPRLAALVGLDSSHDFSPEDGQAWNLFLSGCLYEFSDAWDDFVNNYEREIQSARLLSLATESAGDDDAETQG